MIDFSQVLKSLDGRPFKEPGPEGEDGKPALVDITLKSLAQNALINVLPGDDKLSATEKLKLFMTAQKLEKGEELATSDVAKIAERIAKIENLPHVLSGQALYLLGERA